MKMKTQNKMESVRILFIEKEMEFASVLSILIALIILVSLHLIKLQRKSAKTTGQPPPGPKGLPIIGNLHQFDSAKPHEFLWKLSRKYGPLIQLKLGCRPTLVISSARTAKEAFKTQDLVFSGRPSLVAQQKLSYGLDIAFSPYNEYWREIRKICVLHLFTLKRVQSFRPIREDEISLAIKEISNSQVIDLSSMMLDLTSSLICRVGFGKKFDKRTREKFDELLKESQAMYAGFFVADYFPWLSWIDKISGMNGRLEKNFNDFDSFYQELIIEHLHQNRPETMKEDILDVLIQLKEEKLAAFDLTWDHIKAVLVDIFVAGTETGAAAIVWAMTALMKKPSTMKRVQAEIREFVGRKGIVDEDDIQGLSYLKAIVKEVLRLYPPAPVLIPRETLGNCNIEGYDIKAKTLVFVNAWAIARDPEYWENPDEFEPERFLNSSIDVKGKDFNVIPFGAGRRGCPGISMGLATVELALANLLYTFDWELPVGVKIEDIDTNVSPGLTMHKKNPLCLVAKKYQ